jgi:V8-like Glu-specific endopeptidase
MKQLPDSLESPFLNQEILAPEPRQKLPIRIIRLAEECPFEAVSIEIRETDPVALTNAADPDEWVPESEQLWEIIDGNIYEYLMRSDEEREDEIAHAETEDEEASIGEEEQAPAWEHDTAEGIKRKLKLLSLLPHSGRFANRDIRLSPGLMNPGIYDGPVKFKIADQLQKCLNGVMNKREFRHIKVALVDITKGVLQPEFAGFFHKQQVKVENISKIAVMLAVFQLRHDLRVALQNNGFKTLDELFDKIRDDWSATQLDVRAPAQPFSGKITRRRDLVLFKRATVQLTDPKSPQLERVFGAVPAGDPAIVEFSTTGQTRTELERLADDFRDDKPDSKKNIDDLGFRERLRMMMMDRIRASNYAASTIVADIGYLYIASILLQSGLFDLARGGGLWLASNYAGKKWTAGVAIGGAESASAASVAAFLTLLMQDQLVDRDASTDMRDLLTEDLGVIGFGSRSKLGLEKLPEEGSLITVLSKGGMSIPEMHDFAVIERQSNTTGKDVIRYIAVGLDSKKAAEWQSLIVELDKCILKNNSLSPSGETEQEFPSDESEPAPLTEEEKGIIGRRDDRIPVKDTLAVPFRWICRIWIQSRIKFPGGREQKTGLAPLATGVLISPRHVLTAAHPLHNIEERGSITEEHEAIHVEVAPAANDGLTPFGRIEADSWKIASNWKPGSKSSAYDYALITLKEPVGEKTLKEWKGKHLCYWGSSTCGSNTSVDDLPSVLAKKIIGASVVTAGYPGS